MSVNFNRKRLKGIIHGREYTLKMKDYMQYCYICNKRAGKWNMFCGYYNVKLNKSWKQYRKIQYVVKN